ncbi:2-amino-4-hydroxy-6-hydroxymethyldihydropteridine diphosphokinase [Aliidiomarina sedimenti]|uniref:2-amino-4-hydroxy-6-hydroxymethyldihydropteridine pyrophosphokinase n=1 Tax=Aliidiomarina sedimenti TaxID=1933879 RepID=A0ABY0BUQ7_9GAMM|nr:2-amino-4-hydroxy-6-hydroxymethyldihydropteridine diphosphokinase [Aliidiomarina sedimenti]RUO27929.1 2-amino-4-hydroxy-6-hydroxymethyldihydropteridine diphosphokinase [Aliidiomarina sedimenti]
MALAYLGLGANLNDPQAQLHFALQQLTRHSEMNGIVCSSLYASKPMGPQDQPDYVNAVVAVETTLTPTQLLSATQSIENAAGRVRGQHWGPRTLDIDILLYDTLCITAPDLSIPHPGLESREFVLVPLAEIAPQLVLPNGKQVAALAQQIPLNGLDKIAPPVTMQS